MSTLDDFAREFGPYDLDPTDAGERYIPQEIGPGRKHPPYSSVSPPTPIRVVRPPVKSAEDMAADRFLEGLSCGLALGLIFFFLLAAVALWWGLR